jgi:hypothetical protein
VRRFVYRTWTALGDYPMTVLGVCIGVVFAVFFWTRLDGVEHRVQRIERQVVVIERQGQRSRAIGRCTPADPSSRACRELRGAILTLNARERRAIERQLHPAPVRPVPRPPRAPRTGRTPTPSVQTPKADIPPRQPEPPVGPPPPRPDLPATVTVPPSPAAVAAPTPPTVTAETPVGGVSVTVPPVPPLPVVPPIVLPGAG